MSQEPRDVLSPLAACVLFGRSGEAVRRATNEGLVKSPFSLAFTAKRIRMIDLESALNYWGRDSRPHEDSFKSELAEMRRQGITVCKSTALTSYRVLHPYPLMITGGQVDYLEDQEIA